MDDQYCDAIAHGRPRPRKTLTEFEPVIFPMDASALSEFYAAVILAKVSGREVPNATIVIAVIESSIPSSHPRRVANYSTIKVQAPMNIKETTNEAFPLQ